MLKPKKFLLSLSVILPLIFLALPCISLAADEETLTITTYYPSPYGSYRQLTADQIAIGSGYRNPTYADGSLYVQGNVGIGTTSPSARLDVSGGIQLGDDASPCTADKAGTLRWNSNSLQVCNGSSWSGVGGALPGTLGGVCKPDGTPVAPAASCYLTGYFDNRPGWAGWMVYSYEITSCTPGWDYVTVYRNGTGYGTGYCLKQ